MIEKKKIIHWNRIQFFKENIETVKEMIDEKIIKNKEKNACNSEPMNWIKRNKKCQYF